MKRVIHEIDKKTRRISFTYPSQGNLMEIATKRFSSRQKAKAKKDFKKFKDTKPFAWKHGRDRLVQAIATTKITPSYELKVTLQPQ